MSKCKSCGAEIKWILTHSGKKMPVDKRPVPYRTDPSGSLLLVTMNGVVERGTLDLDSGQAGYVSHFATCPNANEHRKRGKE